MEVRLSPELAEVKVGLLVKPDLQAARVVAADIITWATAQLSPVEKVHQGKDLLVPPVRMPAA